MRVLCVDPGEKRIGLAVSDPSGTIARPLTILEHRSREVDAREIVHLAESLGVGLIVVGVPYTWNGTIGPAARRALRLADAIREVGSITVMTWDESGSSRRAQALLQEMHASRKKRREPLDHRAAAIILQDFLDIQADLKTKPTHKPDTEDDEESQKA
ncbi:MAG: Holliday junction resolvase RuvX [Thermanaerothrix sp.]|jgi:putative Holliday junction resolvase|uniref:Holliday junction resolvase RuvX n=1 Tax=Thermanaerothrix sp. TaxID=2972675 RepID=UPI003C7D8F2F